MSKMTFYMHANSVKLSVPANSRGAGSDFQSRRIYASKTTTLQPRPQNNNTTATPTKQQQHYSHAPKTTTLQPRLQNNNTTATPTKQQHYNHARKTTTLQPRPQNNNNTTTPANMLLIESLKANHHSAGSVQQSLQGSFSNDSYLSHLV